MTLYVGEATRVIHTASREGTALTDSDVSDVLITIYQGTEEVESETSMDWDADEGHWFYLWDTTGLDPGTYRAKVRIEGVDGGSVWEYKRLRLARNPV
jgi:hypothetical protein